MGTGNRHAPLANVSNPGPPELPGPPEPSGPPEPGDEADLDLIVAQRFRDDLVPTAWLHTGSLSALGFYQRPVLKLGYPAVYLNSGPAALIPQTFCGAGPVLASQVGGLTESNTLLRIQGCVVVSCLFTMKKRGYFS